MTSQRRRIFWGQSLAQAVARAARYHRIAVERVDYVVHGKRHGFVKHPRAYLIEVDPERPARAAGEDAPAAPAKPRREQRAKPAEAREAAAAKPAPPADEPARATAAEPKAAPAPRRARSAPSDDDRWDAPDEEAALAAAEAARQLVRFAGLELEPRVALGADRLEIELEGEGIGGLDVELLDEIELLLPRAIVSLCGRHVRCRLDGAGLRAAREKELEGEARAAAERVLASGEEVVLEPLNPAERRIVHLALEPVAGIRTDSLGGGFLKRVRIAPISGA